MAMHHGKRILGPTLQILALARQTMSKEGSL